MRKGEGRGSFSVCQGICPVSQGSVAIAIIVVALFNVLGEGVIKNAGGQATAGDGSSHGIIIQHAATAEETVAPFEVGRRGSGGSGGWGLSAAEEQI